MSRTKPAGWWVAIILSIAAVIPLACGDDDPAKPPTPVDYCPLGGCNNRQNVLQHLELAYNNRAITEYNKILDPNFTMYFSSADVLAGKTPEQWGRQDEISASRNLFDRAYTDTNPSDGIQPRCEGIHMDVKWEDGVQWQEIEPASAPDEKWYTATVFYQFQFDIEGDVHLINNQSAKAQFTVRNAGTESQPQWRLVEMRDLNSSSNSSASSSSTEQSTWGQIKTLYRP